MTHFVKFCSCMHGLCSNKVFNMPHFSLFFFSYLIFFMISVFSSFFSIYCLILFHLTVSFTFYVLFQKSFIPTQAHQCPFQLINTNQTFYIKCKLISLYQFFLNLLMFHVFLLFFTSSISKDFVFRL